MLEVIIDKKEDRPAIVRALRKFGPLRELGVVASVIGVDTSIENAAHIEKIDGVVKVVDGNELVEGFQTQTLQNRVEGGDNPAYSFNNLKTLGVTLDRFQWDLEYAQTVLTLNHSVDGTGVTVGIVDSGVVGGAEFGPRFLGRIYERYSGVTEHPHANVVAGVAAGASFGIAPGAGIVCARALNASNQGFASDLVEAMDDVGVRHDNVNNEQHIVNCSFGGGSDIYDTVALDLADSGVPVIAAAGNSGLDIDASGVWPAASANVFTVGGVNYSTNVRHPESNFGASVNMWGQYNDHATVDKDGVRVRSSGTSFAAPQVAGVAALMLQDRTKMTTLAEVNAFYAELSAAGVDDVLGQSQRRVYYPLPQADISFTRTPYT